MNNKSNVEPPPSMLGWPDLLLSDWNTNVAVLEHASFSSENTCAHNQIRHMHAVVLLIRPPSPRGIIQRIRPVGAIERSGIF
jgi:hypothetical protein